MDDPASRAIECDGFALLPRVYTADEVESIRAGLAVAFAAEAGAPSSIRTGAGGVYAARNVLDCFPQSAELWRKPALVEFLQEILGAEFGLVRVLYFDKPPGRTWSLPWHKDVTIAVRDADAARAAGYKVHRKAGVPHVEPPTDVLEAMLTLRLHLDDVTDENGPLKVLAGSHRSGKRLALSDGRCESIFAVAGDVLAVRPLVAHCSGKSAEHTRRHRRILHFEFSGTATPPDGLSWRDFRRSQKK